MSKNSKHQQGEVIDFTNARKAKIEERRRKYERVIFKQLLGVYCVAEGEGLKAVELLDVSEEGLSFQLPSNSRHIDSVSQKTECTFRLYFSQDTFLPISCKIKYKRDHIEDGQKYVRFGCTVDTTVKNYEAYKLFVNFLSKYAETSQQDKGDLKFFFF